jgi:hypothetical protein
MNTDTVYRLRRENLERARAFLEALVMNATLACYARKKKRLPRVNGTAALLLPHGAT